MRFLSLLLLLGPSVALAQLSPLSLSVPNAGTSTTLTFGKDDCGASQSVTWTVTSGTVLFCNDLVVWATRGTCGNEPVTGDETLATVDANTARTQGTGTVSVPLADMPFFGGGEADGGSNACGQQGTLEGTICASIGRGDQLGGCDSFQKGSPSINVVYDAEPPGRPEVTSVGVLDSALSVQVKAEEGAFVEVQLKEATATDFRPASDNPLSPDVRQAKIEGLTNGTLYDVRAVAIDAAGNRSVESEVVQGTPEFAQGFFDAYKQAGGAEEGGGCSAAGAGLLAPLALLALMSVRRRR